MPNMSPVKHPMPEQDPQVRSGNFQEVALGYTAEMAVEEAQRCLQCKKPLCVSGCPVNIHIPEFIAQVARGDFKAAYEIIRQTNGLPAASASPCASGARRGSPWPSAVWSGSWPTGTGRT